ncbi:MAG: DUF4810 domain-containing protein [Muribaculaceae bacterium]|nr:DUF4810 domain-containing protein [Muribaculaceae bacterium]
MKNYIILALLAFAITSCGTTDTLYSWNDYEDVSYNYSKDPSAKNEKKLNECFNKIIKKPGGMRKAVPPGLFAEHAYLLLKQGKKAEAVAMLKEEIKLYPESKEFIEKTIKQIEQ